MNPSFGQQWVDMRPGNRHNQATVIDVQASVLEIKLEGYSDDKIHRHSVEYFKLHCLPLINVGDIWRNKTSGHTSRVTFCTYAGLTMLCAASLLTDLEKSYRIEDFIKGFERVTCIVE